MLIRKNISTVPTGASNPVPNGRLRFVITGRSWCALFLTAKGVRASDFSADEKVFQRCAQILSEAYRQGWATQRTRAPEKYLRSSAVTFVLKAPDGDSRDASTLERAVRIVTGQTLQT